MVDNSITDDSLTTKIIANLPPSIPVVSLPGANYVNDANRTLCNPTVICLIRQENRLQNAEEVLECTKIDSKVTSAYVVSANKGPGNLSFSGRVISRLPLTFNKAKNAAGGLKNKRTPQPQIPQLYQTLC